MVKKVSIKIKGGKISADYEGFVGQDCKRLEETIRINGLEAEQEDKPELYQQSLTDTNTATS